MSGWTQEDIWRLNAKRRQKVIPVEDESLKAVPRPVEAPRRPSLGKSGKQATDWSETLLGQLRALNMPLPEQEYRFHETRKWRMDLAWVARKIYAECDGGEDSHGRHGRGYGMRSDCEKTNEAALLGWTAFRFTGSQVKSGYAIGILERALASTPAVGAVDPVNRITTG